MRSHALTFIASWLRPLLLIAALAIAPGWVLAHSSSNSYLLLSEREGATVLRADLHLRDIDLVFDLDADRDGQVVWSEVVAREAQVLNALFPLLDRNREATLALFELVKHQPGYG